MKDSARYATKMKSILSGARDGVAPEVKDLLRLMLGAILEEDAPDKQAAAALAAVEEEFVDFNELRVSPVKDIVDCIGDDYPGARLKAETMVAALNSTFEHGNALSLDRLLKKPKREVRKILAEQLRLSLYAEALVTLMGFGGHAIPVDNLLLDGLKLEEFIHPESDLADLQGFLERIISNKDAVAGHLALRKFAAKVAPKVYKDWDKRDKALREKQAIQAAADAKLAAEQAAIEAAKAAKIAEKAELALREKNVREKAAKLAAKKPAKKAK
jgi:endonuclease-3